MKWPQKGNQKVEMELASGSIIGPNEKARELTTFFGRIGFQNFHPPK